MRQSSIASVRSATVTIESIIDSEAVCLLASIVGAALSTLIWKSTSLGRLCFETRLPSATCEVRFEKRRPPWKTFFYFTRQSLGDGLSKPARFVLACILWANLCKDEQNVIEVEQDENDCFTVCIDDESVVAEYVQLLYGRRLNLALMRKVFSAMWSQDGVYDIEIRKNFFDRFEVNSGGFFYRRPISTFMLTASSAKLEAFDFPIQWDLYQIFDKWLGWPRGLAMRFFSQFPMPVPLRMQDLVKRLTDTHMGIPKPKDFEDFHSRFTALRKYIPEVIRKPVICPLCQSRDTMIDITHDKVVDDTTKQAGTPLWQCSECGLQVKKAVTCDDEEPNDTFFTYNGWVSKSSEVRDRMAELFRTRGTCSSIRYAFEFNGKAVYASVRKITGPVQTLDFVLVDGHEMNLATEEEIAEIESRLEWKEWTF